MNGFDRQRALSALVLLVMAAFVASGAAPSVKWRGWLRAAAVIGFALAVAACCGEIAWWWIGGYWPYRSE